MTEFPNRHTGAGRYPRLNRPSGGRVGPGLRRDDGVVAAPASQSAHQV